MIEHIRTVGFKGFDLDESIPPKVIYSGKNKSGKSTRAGAIAIALYGHIPFSTAGKRPGDILDSFGKDSMIAAVTIGGKEFGRKFSRNEKGVVSHVMQVDKKRASADNFAILLNKAGAPRIADVAEFMKQSEAKKIDTLFDLFPNDALSSIDTEIEKAKEDVSRLEKKKGGADSTVVRLTNSKQAIQIPAGSIAEVQAEINKTEIQIVELEEQLKQAEIKEAKSEAKEATKKEIAKDGGMSRDEAISMINGMSPGESHEQITPKNDGDDYHGESFPPLQSSEILPQTAVKASGFFFGAYVKASILRIIEALEGTGCETCAALIVAKQELKKFKGVS